MLRAVGTVKTYVTAALRKVIGRLANLTPGVFYYSRDLEARVDGVNRRIAVKHDGSRAAAAATALCSALNHELPDGMVLTIELHGVTNKGRDIGSFEVTMRRI